MLINNHLKIVNWNGRSILPKRIEFFDFLVRHKIDVATVSETWLKQSNSFYHPEYRCIRGDRQSSSNERGGGVLIAIRRGIKFSQLSLRTKTIEAIGIEIHHGTQPIHILAAYFPGSHRSVSWSMFRKDITSLTRRDVPFFVCGDFNARHRQWNCTKANKAGSILAAKAAASNFFIHAPPTFTYYPRGGRRPSTLDLVLSNNMVDMSSLSAMNELSSDHLPVCFKVDVSVPFDHAIPTTKCYARANWQLFQRSLNQNIDLTSPTVTSIDNAEAIDDCIQTFTNALAEAEEIAVPAVPVKRYDDVKLPDSTLQLIKLRNTRRRQWYRSRNPYLEPIVESLNSRIGEECAKARNQKFSATIRTLENGSRDVWKISRALRNTVKYSPPLQQNTTLVAAPKEKANLLAESFAGAHRNALPTDPISASAVENSVLVITSTALDSVPIIRPREVERIVKRLKPRKAPGQDGVRNILLKRLPRKGLVMLTKIINACLKHSYFPTSWKHAIVTAIPKAGKDITLSTNYRPISLLPTMSKILERVVLTRIEDHITDRGIIPAQQFGFKRGHSTNHQLVRLTQHIQKSFNSGQSAGMVLLDVEKAYDSVWQEAILHKMRLTEFPMYILKLLHAFLKGRTFQVSVDGELSSPQQIPFGVPQGAVLSPSLYNIFTSDVAMVDEAEYFFFADDTGFVATDKDPQNIIDHLQSAQDTLENYQRRWKIKVNAAKTQAVFFTRRRSQRYLPQSQVYAVGHPVQWSDQVKYLGLTFDKKLRFDKHVAASLDKCKKLTKMLYPLVCRRSRLSNANKILLYKLIFRPTLTYGLPAWHGCAQSHRKRLQVQQNKILKMMLDLPFNFPTEDLQDAANTEMLETWTNRLLHKFRIRCTMSENDLIVDLVP